MSLYPKFEGDSYTKKFCIFYDFTNNYVMNVVGNFVMLFVVIICVAIYNGYEKCDLLYLRRAYMRDKFVGVAKVGEKGQIVIPKEARDMFEIVPGDCVVVLCDKKKGMAIVKSEVLESTIDKAMPEIN